MLNTVTCVKLTKRLKIGFQDQISFNAGQKYAILSTFIKLPFVIKIFVMPIFEWLFFTQALLYYIDDVGLYCLCSKVVILLFFIQMNKFLALSLSDVVFIMLINVKMPTIVGILTFMSRINFVLS